MNRAKELSLTAKPLDAITAERWGLVNKVVQPGGEVLKTAIEIAESILKNKQEMVLKYKSVLNDGFKLSFAEGAALEKVMLSVLSYTQIVRIVFALLLV